MGSLNPVEDTLAVKIKDLESRISSMERARQPYAAVWVEINEPAVYTDSDTSPLPFGVFSFENTGFDANSRFSLGDKLRLKQGGSYKYFYIIDLTSTVLTITGGTDYTLTNAIITDIARSSEPLPVGHPGLFNWNPNYNIHPDNTMSASSGSQNNHRFLIEGSILTMYVRKTSFQFSGTPSGVWWGYLPVASEADAVVNEAVKFSTAFDDFATLTMYDGDSVSNTYFSLIQLSGVNYSTGTNASLWIKTSYIYTVN